MESDAVCAVILLPSVNETDAEGARALVPYMRPGMRFEYCGASGSRCMRVRGRTSDVESFIAGLVSMYPSASAEFVPADVPGGKCAVSMRCAFASEGWLPLKRFDSYRGADPSLQLLDVLREAGTGESLLISLTLEGREKPVWLETILRRVRMETQKGYMTSVSREERCASGGIFGTVETARFADPRKGVLTVLLMLFLLAALFFGIAGLYGRALLFLAASALPALISRSLPSPFGDPWYRSDLEAVKAKVSSQSRFNLVSLEIRAAAEDRSRAGELARMALDRLGIFDSASGSSIIPALSPYAVMELSDAELADLWHIPYMDGSVSPGALPVRGAERRPPEPSEVTGFYPIGSSSVAPGGSPDVFLSRETLKHNAFLIGKPGTGKTTLMEHIARAAMEDAGRESALIVIDPHGDMFTRLTGCIPKERIDDVVLLDFGDPDYVVPYNPLDVDANGLTSDQAAQLIVDIGKALWTSSWGPRMQIPLQRAVSAIAAHNRSMPRSIGADGLSMLGVLLSAQKKGREKYLREIRDERARESLLRYFLFDFDSYNDYMKEQIIMPVLSKSYRFEESPMLEYFSPPRSVLDPKDIITGRKILLVNTRMSRFGTELSDFIGSFVINVILKEISRQGEDTSTARTPVLLIIDEFQTYSGVPWQELLAQLRKWGGRTVLGTQSLASMRTEELRDLPGIIMSGVYALFAFTVNGEDADYLSRNELSERFGGPSRDSLISLEPYSCYARLMSGSGHLTRPFCFRTAAPVPSDEKIRAEVLDRREKYAVRRKDAVEDALRYLEKIERCGFYAVSQTHQERPALTQRGKRSDADRLYDCPPVPDPETEKPLPEKEAVPARDDSGRRQDLREKYGDLF